MARKRPAMLSGRLLGYSGALVTALLSAALVDEATEWLSNAGVLGGSAADVHQEMAAPVALAALSLLAVLSIVTALRARAADRLAFHAASSYQRLGVAAATLVAGAAIVVLMETAETLFGGTPVFDPSSVYVIHLPFVVLAYAIVAPLVGALLRACLNAASKAGVAMVGIVARFLRVNIRTSAPASRPRRLGTRALAPTPVAIAGNLGLRAPPRAASFAPIS